MDGLSNRERATFLSIMNLSGKPRFYVRSSEGVVGAVSRENKEGKIVWEIPFDTLTGYLKEINVVTTEKFGKQFQFVFETEKGSRLIWNSPYSNSFSKAFLKILPNIDLSKPFEITPSSKEKDGKNYNSVFVVQDGIALKHFYTKDSDELPKMVQIIVKGNEQWDDTDQMAFLEAKAMEKMSNTLTVAVDNNTASDDDDLPF